jgi:hypothetical protein
MNPGLLRRQAALAAVALLAAVAVIALVTHGEEPADPVGGAAVPTVRWEEARVAVFGQDRDGEQTACGVTLAAGVVGVAHPVLPCGVDLVLAHGGREVRTDVIEQAPAQPGRAFHVTTALAEELGIEGEAAIRWRFPQ